MKRNTKKLSEREVEFTNGVIWICHLSAVGKGKMNGLCEKEMIVVILLMK